MAKATIKISYLQWVRAISILTTLLSTQSPSRTITTWRPCSRQSVLSRSPLITRLWAAVVAGLSSYSSTSAPLPHFPEWVAGLTTNGFVAWSSTTSTSSHGTWVCPKCDTSPSLLDPNLPTGTTSTQDTRLSSLSVSGATKLKKSRCLISHPQKSRLSMFVSTVSTISSRSEHLSTSWPTLVSVSSIISTTVLRTCSPLSSATSKLTWRISSEISAVTPLPRLKLN